MMNTRFAVPDWYGRLNVTRQRPMSRPTPATDLWMILYDDWFDQEKRAHDQTLFREVMAFRKHVEQKFSDAVSFDFLPFIFVRCSQADVQSLVHIPRFKFALPQTTEVEDYLPILRGINALRSETGHQLYEWQEFVDRGGVLPDEKFVGGMIPVGEYPPPLDPQRIVADETVHRDVPPAWMPVLNFSIGPMLPESPANPVLFALSAASNTHLVVVAAGNAGVLPDRTSLNEWAPIGAALLVGAAEDDKGMRLADYSSTGAPADEHNHPDVVAFGTSSLGAERGTSFAAPRVSKIGCIASAATFQAARVLDEFQGRSVGVPLVGWGMIDTGSETSALPARDGANVLPFGGLNEQVLLDAFHQAAKAGGQFHFYLNGALLRSMILKSAKPMPGYGVHQVGAGFVNENLFLDWLSRQSVGEFLEPFGAVAKIPPAICQMKLFDRSGLADLAGTIRRSRPTWFFDYERQRFGVNRTPDKGEMSLPLSGRGYPHSVHVAAS